MQVVTGKNIRRMDAAEFAAWRGRRAGVVVDLGTGDGRFVRELAARRPELGAIGVDLCAANLSDSSRRAPDNALFVVGDALAIPAELNGVAARVTINFPWGSLLRGMLAGDAGLLEGLGALGREGFRLEVRLNAGALAEQGWTMDAGRQRVIATLAEAGFAITRATLLGPGDLRRGPTTWAKRLAFGRDPRAVRIEGRLARATERTEERAARSRASGGGQRWGGHGQEGEDAEDPEDGHVWGTGAAATVRHA